MEEFNKLSIGKLRPAPARTKLKSPNMLGTVTIQRSTLEALLKQMNDADADEGSVQSSRLVQRRPRGKIYRRPVIRTL